MIADANGRLDRDLAAMQGLTAQQASSQSTYLALMNQIGGLTQAAAYAQAHAQARAIREGILNANTVALQ